MQLKRLHKLMHDGGRGLIFFSFCNASDKSNTFQNMYVNINKEIKKNKQSI